MNKTQLKKRKRMLAALKRPASLSDAELKSWCAEALRYIDDLECKLGAHMILLDTLAPCFDTMDEALHRLYKDLVRLEKLKKKAPARKATRKPRAVTVGVLH